MTESERTAVGAYVDRMSLDELVTWLGELLPDVERRARAEARKGRSLLRRAEAQRLELERLLSE